jgi:hypothetical protein
LLHKEKKCKRVARRLWGGERRGEKTTKKIVGRFQYYSVKGIIEGREKLLSSRLKFVLASYSKPS